MRVSGFYWIRRKGSPHWDVDRWDDGSQRFVRTGGSSDSVEVDERRIPTPAEGDDPESKDTAPVTLVEVWRVLNRLQLENPGRTYSKAQIFADGSGNIEQGNPNVIEWSFGTLEELSAGVRAAITNIDAPPKPSTLEVMRGTK